MHWDHEPSTERSADSLVRESWKFGSRGHGCPRSWQWFMERLHSPSRMHWDHEPSVIPLTRPPDTLSPTATGGVCLAVVELVTLRRVAPRTATQKLLANRAVRASGPAAERGGVVAARRPPPR